MMIPPALTAKSAGYRALCACQNSMSQGKELAITISATSGSSHGINLSGQLYTGVERFNNIPEKSADHFAVTVEHGIHNSLHAHRPGDAVELDTNGIIPDSQK